MTEPGSSGAAQAVRVKFDVEETDAAKKRRISSYSYLQKMQDEEMWLNLKYKNFKANYLFIYFIFLIIGFCFLFKKYLKLKCVFQDPDSVLLRDSLQCNLKFDTYPKFSNDSNKLMRIFVPKADEDKM